MFKNILVLIVFSLPGITHSFEDLQCNKIIGDLLYVCNPIGQRTEMVSLTKLRKILSAHDISLPEVDELTAIVTHPGKVHVEGRVVQSDAFLPYQQVKYLSVEYNNGNWSVEVTGSDYGFNWKISIVQLMAIALAIVSGLQIQKSWWSRPMSLGLVSGVLIGGVMVYFGNTLIMWLAVFALMIGMNKILKYLTNTGRSLYTIFLFISWFWVVMSLTRYEFDGYSPLRNFLIFCMILISIEIGTFAFSLKRQLAITGNRLRTNRGEPL